MPDGGKSALGVLIPGGYVAANVGSPRRGRTVVLSRRLDSHLRKLGVPARALAA
jgi:hypothetical protein